MNLTRAQLDDAIAQGVLAPGQGDALWAFLAAQQTVQATTQATAHAQAAAQGHPGHDPAHQPSFKPAHILYYLGGMIAIGAMSLFMTLGWEQLGGGGLLAIATGYAVLLVGLTEHLLHRRRLPLPAGITGALVVVAVPLAVYGAQQLLGLWPTEGGGPAAYRDYHTSIDWRWLMMELATLAAGAVALWRWRLPFLVMPVAVTLWYLSMDLVPFLLGAKPGEFFSTAGQWISTGFGLCMLLLAVGVDGRSRSGRDFAFWIYLFGALSFWGGLTSMESNSELGKALYCAINLLMIGLGAALSRRVLAVFGGIGVAIYLGHLSYTVFKDSLLFPLALTAIGLAVVAAGVLWQRHEVAIGQRLRAWLPPSVRHRLALRAG